MQQNDQVPALTSYTINSILERPLPRSNEQADLLIRWLAENIEGPGETLSIEAWKHSAIFGAKSNEGFYLILNHLFEIGLVEGKITGGAYGAGVSQVTSSFKGWGYCESNGVQA
jgi:hypothetical protein